jgi:hypothetical protein
MGRHTVIVRFAETEVEDPRIRARATSAIDEPPSAELIIPNEILTNVVVNYQSPVQVIAVTDTDQSVVFDGYVDRVTPERDKTRITLTRL